MNVTRNYDTVINALLFDLNGVDNYPRFTGSIATKDVLRNNDIIEVENIPLQTIVSDVSLQSGIYYGTLTQYLGFNSAFAKTYTFQSGTDYQQIISYIFNNNAFFAFPLVGAVDNDFAIPEGSTRWELLSALADEFAFTVEWDQTQNLYFIRPFETSPCRTITDRGYIQTSTKTMYNHVNVYNKSNMIVDVYTEDYFKVGAHSMSPVEMTTAMDRYNTIIYAQRLLKKERQGMKLITGVFDPSDYAQVVNDIGRLWDWDGIAYRVRTISIKNGAIIAVAGQEDDDMIMFDLNERADMRGMPRIWV